MPPVLLPVILGPGPANSEPKADAGAVGAAQNRAAASASDSATESFRIIAIPPSDPNAGARRRHAAAFRASLKAWTRE